MCSDSKANGTSFLPTALPRITHRALPRPEVVGVEAGETRVGGAGRSGQLSRRVVTLGAWLGGPFCDKHIRRPQLRSS